MLSRPEGSSLASTHALQSELIFTLCARQNNSFLAQSSPSVPAVSHVLPLEESKSINVG